PGMVPSAKPAAWRHWGRTAPCPPVRPVTPAGDEAIAQALKEAAAGGLTVKGTGTGHSFTDIACTDGVQIKLDRHARLLDVDTNAKTVTVEAGIPLMRLAGELADHGLALSNLGDIGYQTVAGATSTATHATGAK